jgi:hypothetical protein
VLAVGGGHATWEEQAHEVGAEGVPHQIDVLRHIGLGHGVDFDGHCCGCFG